MEAALRKALAGYTHARTAIAVKHAPLAKAPSFQIDSSTISYTKRSRKGAVEITKALAAGSIALVQGRYGLEGLRFTVLLQRDASAWTVLWSEVAET